MIDSLLFKPAHRSKLITYKHIYNAIRQTILRHSYIKRYEWAYVLNGDISASLYEALTRMANTGIVKQYLNTFYFREAKHCKLKVYNLSAAQPDRKELPAEFKLGDRLKIEITYLKPFFKNGNSIRFSLNQFTNYDQIAALLKASNLEVINTFLMDNLEAEEMRNMMQAAGIFKRSEFMSKIFEKSTTQTTNEKRTYEILSKIEALESTLNQAVERLDILEAEHQEMKAIIGFKDKRKLRVVK